jgi:hypothetical protein
MTIAAARRQVFSQLVAAGFTENEAAAAVAALVVAGSLADQVPEWIPAAFAARGSYPARDIVEQARKFRDQLPRSGGCAPPDPALLRPVG